MAVTWMRGKPHWMRTTTTCRSSASRQSSPRRWGEWWTEQIGPRGKDAWLTGSSDGETGARTKHKHQWVIHGPVVYADRLYETIAGEQDEIRRLAACLFAKPITHAAQREYRFVVLNGGADEDTVLLKISGMMRDALALKESGLIRQTPEPEETVGEDGAALPRPVKGSERQQDKRATVKQRKEEREERRVETRNSEGQVLSSDIERRESVEERVATGGPRDGRAGVPGPAPR